MRLENEKVLTKRLPNLFHLNLGKLLQFFMNYIDERNVRNEEEQYLPLPPNAKNRALQSMASVALK